MSSTDESSMGDADSVEELERRIDEKFLTTYTDSIFDRGAAEIAIYVLAFVFFAYHMAYGYSGWVARSHHGIRHLALVLVAWAMLRLVDVDRSTLRGNLLTTAYGVYGVLAVLPLYYMDSNYRTLVARAGAYTQMDMLMGALLIGLVLVALLSISRLITAIAVFGLAYSYFGPYAPSILNHGGLTPARIITMNSVEFQGLLGTLLQISATWVVIFLILAGLMEKYGGMAKFIKGVTRIAVTNRYIEIGQVAVAASAFMGSINGSTAANTATTGAFTIPLMKENGYAPRFAAAIESVASCGGQVLPPIMGAGAFLMAELIDPSYSEIIVAATAPALLFFATVGISISLNSRSGVQQTLEQTEEHTVEQRLFAIARNYEYVAMFAVLLYWLVYVQADPMYAGFWSIATLIGLRFVRAVTSAIGDDDVDSLVPPLETFGRETLEGFRRGLETTVNITILLASLGIVIRALVVTGFAQQLSTQLILIASGQLPVLLVLAMLASIMFGMGMSTTAAYMLVAILVAPSLTEMGLDPLLAHFFVFYFAIVSNITPPIALSVVIAQGIAESGYWETVVDALKIGFPMFLLPYAFVVNDALLHPSPMTGLAFLVVLVGFTSLSVGIAGQMDEPVSVPARVAFAAAGVACILMSVVAVKLVLTAAILFGMVYVSPGLNDAVGRMSWR